MTSPMWPCYRSRQRLLPSDPALFSSESDYLPAVRRLCDIGKYVPVYGYKSQFPKQSDYLHIPDAFIDLERRLRVKST